MFKATKLKVLAVAAMSAGALVAVPALSQGRVHYTGKRPASISLMPMAATTSVAAPVKKVAVKKHKTAAHKKTSKGTAKHTIHTKHHRVHKPAAK